MFGAYSDTCFVGSDRTRSVYKLACVHDLNETIEVFSGLIQGAVRGL